MSNVVGHWKRGPVPESARGRVLLADWGHCMCGFHEWCEVCSRDSAYNRFRDRIKEALDGPPPLLTAADYCKYTVIDIEVPE